MNFPTLTLINPAKREVNQPPALRDGKGGNTIQDAKIVINDQFTRFAFFRPDRSLSSLMPIHIHCGIAKKIVFFGTF